VLVLNNRDLNQVTWEQRVMVGDPKFECSQNLPPFHYAGYAKLLDLNGILVAKPEDIGPALDEALHADRPTVVECLVDPEVPPLPPHVTFKQAKNFMAAVGHGDPHRWRMIEQAAKQVWAGMTAR
jgi:pyruvate dehydrogenase (quinone)